MEDPPPSANGQNLQPFSIISDPILPSLMCHHHSHPHNDSANHFTSIDEFADPAPITEDQQLIEELTNNNVHLPLDSILDESPAAVASKHDLTTLAKLPFQHTPITSLNDLPIEILHLIVHFTYSNNVNISFGKHLEWFAKSMLLVNKKFYLLSVKLFVNYCRFTCPQTFDIFSKLWNGKKVPTSFIPAKEYSDEANDEDAQDNDDYNSVINEEPKEKYYCQSIYKYINILDFQEFTSVGLGRTNRMNNEIQMVTKTTILSFLTKALNLKEFLSSENIQNDISKDILVQIFFKLKKLHSIDFCGSTGVVFSSAFQELLLESAVPSPNDAQYNQSSPSSAPSPSPTPLPHTPVFFQTPITNLVNLSFHDCIDIPNEFFLKLLPLLPNLEKLDLFHTRITGDALFSLNQTCQLTHLSIGCCYQLDKRHIMQFFISHPSTKKRLKWLNMETDNVNDITERELLILLKSLTFTNDPSEVPFLNQISLGSDLNVNTSTKPRHHMIPNYNLQYLNIGGRATTAEVLKFIKSNFIFLKSLHIQNSKITIEELIDFLTPPKSVIMNNEIHNSSRLSMSSLNDYFNTQRDPVSSSLTNYYDLQRHGSIHSNSQTERNSQQQPQPQPQPHQNQNQNHNQRGQQENTLLSSSSSITSLTSLNNISNNSNNGRVEIYQQLRFINVKGNPNISNNWVINNPIFVESCPTLLAWEFDLRILENSANDTFHYHHYRNNNSSYNSFGNGYNIYSVNQNGSSDTNPNDEEDFFWRIFQTNGRRSWLYKLRAYNERNSKYLNYSYNFDKDYYHYTNSSTATASASSKSKSKSNSSNYNDNNNNSDSDNDNDNDNEEEEIDYEILTDDPNYIPNVTRYDPITGRKIEPKLIFYPFLKYASRKIDMSNGPFYTGNNELYKIWPVKFSERGIYKYYALNV